VFYTSPSVFTSEITRLESRVSPTCAMLTPGSGRNRAGRATLRCPGRPAVSPGGQDFRRAGKTFAGRAPGVHPLPGEARQCRPGPATSAGQSIQAPGHGDVRHTFHFNRAVAAGPGDIGRRRQIAVPDRRRRPPAQQRFFPCSTSRHPSSDTFPSSFFAAS
jgi:hypothetical protein